MTAKHPVCEVCGDSIVPGAPSKAGFHKSCFELTSVCRDCKRELPDEEPRNTDQNGTMCHRCSPPNPEENLCVNCDSDKAIFIIDRERYCAKCYRGEKFCQICKREILANQRTKYNKDRLANHLSCVMEKNNIEALISDINRCGSMLSVIFPGHKEKSETANVAGEKTKK